MESYFKNKPSDIFYANMQPYINVYALKNPLVYQYSKIGGQEKGTKINYIDTDKKFIPIRKDQIENIEKELRTEERRNRFNGESIMLTKQEAKIHDELFMHELMATLEDKTLGTGASKHWDKMRKHIDWFIKNNAKAYMVLLD